MRIFHALDFRFQQIEIFLTVAKLENLTEASKQLNMSVSALSKNIKNLEDQLGLVLFQRKKMRLILTPAGKELMQDFQSATNQIQNAVERAHNVQKVSSAEPLVIASTEQFDPEITLIPALQSYQEQQESFSYYLDFYEMSMLLHKLENKDADIAFTADFYESNIKKISGLNYLSLMSGNLCIDISENHPLSARQHIQFKELQEYPFIVPVPAIDGNFERELLLSECEKCSFQPRIEHFSSSMRGTTYAPSRLGVVLSNRQLLLSRYKKRIPIEGIPSSVIMMWRSEDDKKLKDIITFIEKFWLADHPR